MSSTNKNGVRIIAGTTPKPSVRKRLETQSTDRKKEEKDVIGTKSTTSTTRVVTKKMSGNDGDSVRKKPLSTSTNKDGITKVRSVTATKPPVKKNKSIKKEVAVASTPSRKISKTQFFPTKNMYSNALKEQGISIKPPHTSTSSSPRTKPIVTKIVKQSVKENQEGSSDTSSLSERPRTATLRKGSIVNDNIVGPEAPGSVKKIVLAPKQPEKSSHKSSEDEDKYEDDFDSYESDFEQYNSSSSTATNINLSDLLSSSSDNELTEPKSAQKRSNSAGTDEERTLDSGNYELPEYKHKQILDNIKESIEKENSTNVIVDNRSNLGSLSDEGFEDGKSLQFINFLGAQKQYQKRESIEKKRQRGEELLSMIRLDTFSFTLIDLPPVPYEEFIRNFGKRNTLQASSQTGDDAIDEETQTIDQLTDNKWTQFPTVFPKGMFQNIEIYKRNYLGVGSDTVPEEETEIYTNESHLEKFLLSAGNLLRKILSESEDFKNEITKHIGSSNLPFSGGSMIYDTQSWSFLANRPIRNACFWPSSSPMKILTAHGRRRDDSKSLICMWNLYNTKEPENCYAACGDITCCTIGIESPYLIFGGFDDGSITIWDSNESLYHHLGVEKDDDTYIPIRTPTYTTEIDFAHNSKIISMKSLANTSEIEGVFGTNKSEEICSLDENGVLVVWGVITLEENNVQLVHNQGLAHWGTVILVINIRIILYEMYPELDGFKCTDLAINNLDPSHLFVSTNYGVIIHCLTSGGKGSVKKFIPDEQSQANCLGVCPFSPHHFMAGFESGDISIYSRLVEKALIVMSDKTLSPGMNGVTSIQWSYNKPLMFYIKDETNTIQIWNLKVNDMFPIYSIPFKENIVAMTLSPVSSRNRESPEEQTYMMIVSDSGSVHLHLLDQEHGQQSYDSFEEDKRKFLNYINRYV